MQDHIPDALITAFERQYDSSWNDPKLRNERLAMRYGWAAAMEAKPCLHQIQEPAPVTAMDALREAEAALEVAMARILKADPGHSICVTSEAKALVAVRQALSSQAAPVAVGEREAFEAFRLSRITAPNAPVEHIFARDESGEYLDRFTASSWKFWQASRAALAATPADHSEQDLKMVEAAPVVLPENIREGDPYDNPEFEQLARDLGVWGTPQSAIGAQFWMAARNPAAPVALSEPDFWVRPGATIHPDRGWQCWSNDGTATGAFHADTVRALLAGVSAPAGAVPDGWREKFATDVYNDLAAADNQDVPLEEYPARILKVLDSIVGPRHPVVIKWRNDAVRSCIAIAYKYCRDPESQKYLKQDLEAMLTAEPAPQQADARDAAPAAPYSLDADPLGIRELAASAITGALCFGAAGGEKPPAGHWLEWFYNAGAEKAPASSEQDARYIAIGKAIERACAEQPQDTEIIISLERDAGTVSMFDPDGNEHDYFQCDDGFAGVVNQAIDAAIAAQAAQQGGAA